jgi:hypothetical protein
MNGSGVFRPSSFHGRYVGTLVSSDMMFIPSFKKFCHLVCIVLESVVDLGNRLTEARTINFAVLTCYIHFVTFLLSSTQIYLQAEDEDRGVLRNVGLLTAQPFEPADSPRELHHTQSPGKQQISQVFTLLYKN